MPPLSKMLNVLSGRVCPECEANEEEHTCPFLEEIHHDSETLCTCCPECEYQCALDI